MQEFEPKLKTKILTKEFIGKYFYIFVLAILLVGGISYGYTFFTQNRKIASGSITTANLTINFGNREINASNLSVPTTDQEGLSEFSKSLTITNQTPVDGIVKLTLARTSGLALSDLKVAISMNGAIQFIGDVFENGWQFAIMGNETLNVEIRLWPKTSYSGSETTFVGELIPEIKYLGSTAADLANPTGKYVNFNCSSTCEVWQIVKIEDERLVLTRQADYSGADSRTNSNRYNPESFKTVITFNDDSMITSLSTDGLNVYLAKTVKIAGGEGTLANPYELVNNTLREGDLKVIAVITYKDDNNTTVGTQNVYSFYTNFISQVIDDPDFVGWTDGTNNYELGDTIAFTTDTNLTAIIVPKLRTQIMAKCNDSSIAYVQKYNTANGAPIDTPDGSGNEDVCYYTTTSTARNSNAEQNSNVIFGDYCWQIVRTTADGGVKLLYNGPKTADNKCTSDADTTNYSSNPRPSIEGVTGTSHQLTDLSGLKKYGVGFELYDDNGTTKFKLIDVVSADWTTDYANLIGKYTCMNNTDTICTTIYYVGNKQDSNNASTVSYTISAPTHYSLIGTSSFNAYNNSPALVGYMFGDVYIAQDKSFSEIKTDVINKESMSSSPQFYYGDTVSWDGTYYHLIDSSTNQAPTATSAWTNIRSTAGGKYTCKRVNNVAVTYCTTVYYIVANSSSYTMYSVPLSNNETKDKTVTWTYGTGITKSGNTYTLTGTDTLTFKLSDWYTDYENYKDIYVCDDYTSTSCSEMHFIAETYIYQEGHYVLNYTYYFANDVNYNSNVYSYDLNGTIVEIYDWYHQYNTINDNHYMCENYDSVNNTCGANNPVYFIDFTNKVRMSYLVLENVPNIETALVNMLSKNTGTTVNRYNSAIKGVVDNWYKQNIEDKNLSSYIDNNVVYCSDREIIDLGGLSKTGSTTGDYSLRFRYYYSPYASNAKLSCPNVTDRFSKTNEKATLIYSVGLLSDAERGLMNQGFVRVTQTWWDASPYVFGDHSGNSCYIGSLGSRATAVVSNPFGVRPVIVLKPGIELKLGGEGTYNNPYVVKTTVY